MGVHLDDVMLRRTGWHYYHADATKIATEVAGRMAATLGWDAARRSEEMARYSRSLLPEGIANCKLNNLKFQI